ncbi:MAG: cysteine--tRNA ligase [Bdellovibrionales bacterium]
MSEIKVYNTKTRQKETFKPLKDGEVKIYLCGPTVYDFLHIGNFRGAIVFNLIRNWFEKSGFKVTFVYNYTDVDDKIIKRANELKISSHDLATQFIGEFEKDFKALGLKPHDHNPRVTEYMDEIIQMVQQLIEKNHAYVVDGEVFYAVDSFEPYGKLSHKNIDELQSGIRVEIGSKKKNPLDFSLWKPAKSGEPKWSSPWGDGRPGWHIECSAMSHKILGETFDIHGGGIDLIFPHHENEIAQSEGSTGKTMANYWVHNNFINFGSEKMSKSLGNVTTVRKFLEKYNPEILKYLILMAHYRSHSDFSPTQIENAIRALARIYSGLALVQTVLKSSVAPEVDKNFEKQIQEASVLRSEALNDDFNTPEVFARVFELIRSFNAGYRPGMKVTPQVKWRATELQKFILESGELMSLFQEAPDKFLRLLDDMLLEQMGIQRANIDSLIQERNQARQAKDFKKSDELRAQLVGQGIAVHDSVEGTLWEVQK